MSWADDAPQWRQAYAWQQRLAQHAAIELACCGVFHAVTAVPFECPTCQTWYFVPLPPEEPPDGTT